MALRGRVYVALPKRPSEIVHEICDVDTWTGILGFRYISYIRLFLPGLISSIGSHSHRLESYRCHE